MTTPTQPQDFDESVMFRAVEWLEIHRRGDITSATRNEFLFWLRRSPINVEHYIYAATTAEMYRLALKSRTETTEDLIRQARNDNSGVISLTLSRQPSSRIAAAPQRFVFTKRLGLISPVVAAAFFIVLLFVRELISDGYIGFPTKYQTQHTEQGSWRLPDGSMLHLNSGSEAIVWYTNRERFIELIQGQAMFQVAHEKTRRFRVEAGAAQVVSIGTQFDVLRRDTETRVAVREGKVRVLPASLRINSDPKTVLPGTLLEAGRALVLDAQGTSRDSSETVLQATAWLQREIVFQKSLLQVVVNDFNQYSTVPIVIESAEIASMTISGVFGAYDLESFLQFLSSLDGVAVEVKQDRIRVYVVKHFSEQALTVEAGREKSSMATRDRKLGENP